MFWVLFPEWSQHLEWSESKNVRPGNWVLLESWLGHLDIGGWMCFATNSLQVQDPAKEFRRHWSWQGRRGEASDPLDKESDSVWFTANLSSSPTKQKKTKNHSPSYTHTKGKFFKERERVKNKSGSIFEGKRLFIAAKVLIFFFLPLAILWELETSAEKKSIHLSSHKTSVFHRGNGKISPLTGFVNSYWGFREGVE